MENNATFMDALVKAQADLNAYVASLLLFHPDSVADVVQEVNLALIKAAGRYDASRPFMPWAIGFAKCQVLAFLRDSSRERVLFSSGLIDRFSEVYADGRQPAPDAAEAGLLERLKACRAKLKERDRILIALFYEEQVPVKEIARQMKLKDQSIRAMLSDTRRQLGGCIRRLCHLSDDEFERSSADPVREVVGKVTEGRKPSSRLLRQASACLAKLDEEAFRGFVDDLRVDALLRKPRLRKVRRLPSLDWGRAAALAAGFAVLLAGLAYAYRALTSSAPTPVPAPAVVSAATVVSAVPAAVPAAPSPSNAVAVAAVSAAPAPAVVTSSVAAVTAAPVQTTKTKGEATVKVQKQTVAAVAAALALAPPLTQATSAVSAEEGAYGDLKVPFIETRDGDEADIPGVTYLETRDGDVADVHSANSTINTFPPHGTVYSFQ